MLTVFFIPMSMQSGPESDHVWAGQLVAYAAPACANTTLTRCELRCQVQRRSWSLHMDKEKVDHTVYVIDELQITKISLT